MQKNNFLLLKKFKNPESAQQRQVGLCQTDGQYGRTLYNDDHYI